MVGVLYVYLKCWHLVQTLETGEHFQVFRWCNMWGAYGKKYARTFPVMSILLVIWCDRLTTASGYLLKGGDPPLAAY